MGGLAGTAAKLLASLDLDTKPFERGAARVDGSIKKMEGRFGKLGSIAAKGAARAATNLAAAGAVAVGFLTSQVTAGVRSLEDLERVTNATKGVIESTGGAAGVSAEQIRAMAQALEAVTTADDKVIQGAQNLLLTFTGIGKDTFPQASKAMTDMAIALAEGDVEAANFSGAAIQIGKALNDPVRGMTALRKSGVSFTEQQQKQIKTLVDSGKTFEAQQIILKELEKEFGKAGEAAGKGFGADMRRAKDAIEDAQQALATGFLPLISRASKFISTELAKPATLERIRKLGDSLAEAFDQLIGIGTKLPWAQIGDTFKLMGQGAKVALDLFTSMPPWVQTAVLTGWGLNKLTGGALGSLAKEGISVALKMRGSTPANPIFTKEVGLGGGGAAGAAGAAAKGGLGLVSKVFLVGEAIGLGLLVADIATQVKEASFAQAKDIHQTLTDSLASPQTTADLQQKLAGIDEGIRKLKADPIAAALITGPTIAELERMRSEVVAALQAPSNRNRSGSPDDRDRPASKRTLRVYGETEDKKGNINWKKIASATDQLERKSDAQRTAIERLKGAVNLSKRATDSVRTATNTSRQAIVASGRTGDREIVAAIRANRTVVNIAFSSTTVRRASGSTVDWRYRDRKYVPI
jgi:Tfp pilus assembly major pilin PilA